jgi:hypothetical protein
VDQRPGKAADLVHSCRPDIYVVERRRKIDAERADDGVGRTVESQCRADGVGVAAEAFGPVAAADDRHRRSTGRVLARGERAADRHVHAEHVEKARGHARPGQLLGPLDAGQVERVVGHRGQAREHPVPRRELDVRRIGKHAVRDAALRVRARQHEETRRILERQRAQQRGVHDAEDSGVRADADGDDRHGHDREFPGPIKRDERSHQVSHRQVTRNSARPRRRRPRTVRRQTV